MSAFKPGDRVRVTPFEAVVKHRAGMVGGRELVELELEGGHIETWYTAHLEKIPTLLPTTRGSVIRNINSGAIWYHNGERFLPAQRGNTDYKIGPEVSYDVIFDAGAP